MKRPKKESEALKKENAKGRRKALRQLRKLEKGTAALLNEKVPKVLAETERLLQTHNIALMNKYEELSGKHAILVDLIGYLQSRYAVYQKLLDDALPFSWLMWAPEKLSKNAVDRLLFGFVYPKLLVWSKNMSQNERTEFIEKVAINALGLFSEEVSRFLISPESATASNAFVATACAAAVFMPLYTSRVPRRHP